MKLELNDLMTKILGASLSYLDRLSTGFKIIRSFDFEIDSAGDKKK